MALLDSFDFDFDCDKDENEAEAEEERIVALEVAFAVAFAFAFAARLDIHNLIEKSAFAFASCGVVQGGEAQLAEAQLAKHTEVVVTVVVDSENQVVVVVVVVYAFFSHCFLVVKRGRHAMHHLNLLHYYFQIQKEQQEVHQNYPISCDPFFFCL